jgi:probable F420-dependent oxidoreductase
MKVGVFIPLTDRTLPVVRLAPAVEALGFESLWLPDHVLLPRRTRSLSPSGAAPGEAYRRMADPLVLLGAAAAVTRTLILGTAVLVAPVRHPIVTAKQVATLDLLCEGRLRLGVGAGWVREEAEILGVDYSRRWHRAREHVNVMRACWAPSASSFEGEYVRFTEIWCEPKPVQRPHPPVILAGDGERALPRVAEWGDGWMAHARRTPPESVAEGLRRLPALLAEAGRAESSVEVTVFGPEADTAALRRYAEAGAHRAILLLPEEKPAATQDRLRQWSELLG